MVPSAGVQDAQRVRIGGTQRTLAGFVGLLGPDTARALNIGVGTVKSYTARALATLRDDASLRGLLTEEAQR